MILTGAIRSGKTGFLAGILSELGMGVSGFLSPAAYADGRHVGYDLLPLGRGAAIPFIRRTGQPAWERVGGYFFIPEALAEARRVIRESPAESLLIVDEVGPLEMEGGGLWTVLEPALADGSRRSLLVVREACLEEMLGKLRCPPAGVFRLGDPSIAASLLSEIAREPAPVAGREG